MSLVRVFVSSETAIHKVFSGFISNFSQRRLYEGISEFMLCEMGWQTKLISALILPSLFLLIIRDYGEGLSGGLFKQFLGDFFGKMVPKLVILIMESPKMSFFISVTIGISRETL